MRGPISIAVTGAIGLGSEAYAAVKEHRARKHGDIEHKDHLSDEDEWMLDEVQGQMDGDKNIHADPAMLMSMPVNQGDLLPLAYPVIIPQRRPRTRSRGFMRAYAPALAAAQIDQAMFMNFLQGFDDAIKKQGLFIVANLAVGASVIGATALLGSNLFVGVAAFAVHSTVEAGRRMYITDKYNTYLRDMNDNFFQPRGLYALIMSYQPKSASAADVVDLNTQVAMSAAKHGDTGSKFKVSTGTTKDEFQMPEAAPLVFPHLKGATAAQKENAFQKASGFLGDYSDRRAQAVFAAQNPDSSLNVGQARPQFASRFADPNHPVNKGGPLCVLTGGKISKDAPKQETKERENLAAGRPMDEGTGGIVGGMKRKLQENVMYLLIVNRPSDRELENAAQLAAEYQQRQQHS